MTTPEESTRPSAWRVREAWEQSIEQDLADEPTATLQEVMVLAADRDLVARQYANGFREVLYEALPALRHYVSRGHPLETAIIGAFPRAPGHAIPTR